MKGTQRPPGQTSCGQPVTHFVFRCPLSAVHKQNVTIVHRPLPQVLVLVVTLNRKQCNDHLDRFHSTLEHPLLGLGDNMGISAPKQFASSLLILATEMRSQVVQF